jgi:hypothetical protein
MDLQVFEKYFKLPFQTSEVYIKSSHSDVIFNWLIRLDDITRKKILDKINGVTNEKLEFSFIKTGLKICMITSDNRTFPILLIRGFGKLTGKGDGGFGLDNKEAETIQNQMVDFVLGQLNR